MRGFFILSTLMVLALCGCQRQSDNAGPAPLETEVVEPPPEAAIDVSQDAKATRRVESLSGVLPSDVPADLPLHQPATLVDFGSGSARYVTFTSPASPQTVRSDMERRLRAAGWAPEGGESAVFVKDGRRITLTVEPDPVGSLWRLDY